MHLLSSGECCGGHTAEISEMTQAALPYRRVLYCDFSGILSLYALFADAEIKQARILRNFSMGFTPPSAQSGFVSSVSTTNRF